MNDQLIVQGINSQGFGIIPKLIMQDRNISATAKCIYAYFCSFAGGGGQCFPTRKKICYDLCISQDTLSKHLNQLIKYGYISCEQIKENGRFSHNVYTLVTNLPLPKNSDTVKSDTKLPLPKISDTEELDTKNNNNNKNNKEDKKERKKENAKSENQSFDSLIDDYSENEKLRSELKEHLKTRKSKKAAMTNRAIELSLEKLDKLSNNDAEKIQIVQNAIMNGWTTFYPLKDEQPSKITTGNSRKNYDFGLGANYDLDMYESNYRYI